MTPERLQRIQELFHSAVQLHGLEREAFIQSACHDDEALRSSLEHLIQASDPSAVSPYQLPPDSFVNRQLGPYQIVREIGRGGMGTVYLAERADGQFHRTVAVKLVNPHLGTESVLRRFRNERQVLAALDHPNIARLLDGGATDDNLPYLVMEYIDGERIDRWCDARKLSIDRRLRLFQQVCASVHYAHEHGVIHRDLKPDNILIAQDGSAKLLDFGIAKVLDRDLAAETLETTAASRPLTPAFASPEQVRGGSVTAASDIYSLGVILYQLLTGKSPYKGDTSTPGALARAICEQDPTKPSAALGVPPPEDVQRLVKGDLDNIVLKALRKEPAQRYASAAALSADIERFLDCTPVEARPEPLTRRAAAFIRRNRKPVTIAASTIMLVLAAAALATRWLRPQQTATPAEQASVAVVTFENASGDPEADRLADALTEGVIRDLRKIRSLRVMSAKSISRKPNSEIAKTLRVPAIVNGTLIRNGDHLRATVRLFSGIMERPQFSRTYERELREIAALQSEIARAVTGAVRVQLTPAENKRLASWGPVNKDAYEAWLKGNHYLEGAADGTANRSLQYFQQAVEIDPSFALGWIGIADAYYGLSDAVLPPHEAVPKGRAALRRALEIDDSIPEAHSTAGSFCSYEWDWASGEKSFRRAFELAPTYPRAHHRFSWVLLAQGRFDEAIAQAKEAIRLDPITAEYQANLAWITSFAGRPDEAIEICRKALEMDPDSEVTHYTLGGAYLQKGLFRQALVELKKGRFGSTSAAGRDGYAYARSGMRNEALQVLADLETEARTRYVSAERQAVVHLGLGNTDKVFAYLDRAYRQHSEDLTFLKVNPLFDPIRKDPRYFDLLRRMNLL